MHGTEALKEAGRQMQICNACRYCEGLCAVFPAMTLRRSFSDGDLDYLANLCHACGACHYDCQYAPPHEFKVDVPRTMAALRNESYGRYAWPRALSTLFAHNGVAIRLITTVCVAAFILGFIAWHDPAMLLGIHSGPGAFYRLMPHNAMAALFGAAFLFALLAMSMSVRRFWRETANAGEAPLSCKTLVSAVKDAATLRHLHGGGGGCHNADDHPRDRRRLYHHLTFYGFMLCFASTSVATLYHYALDWPAPYAWHELPVVLGTLGGVGIVVGPAGLLWHKWRRDPVLVDESRLGMDVAFILMLFLTGVTGLALLALRDTQAMGVLLALHLGVVFSFFITMPYGKFLHGIYRVAALVRYARENGAVNPKDGD